MDQFMLMFMWILSFIMFCGSCVFAYHYYKHRQTDVGIVAVCFLSASIMLALLGLGQ